MYTRIAGVGAYLPGSPLGNDELAWGAGLLQF
jgi:3-oxoacyl-[acyl-carrier-protein] synthase III